MGTYWIYSVQWRHFGGFGSKWTWWWRPWRGARNLLTFWNLWVECRYTFSPCIKALQEAWTAAEDWTLLLICSEIMVVRLVSELCKSVVSASMLLVKAEDVLFVRGEVVDHPVLLTLEPASLMGPGMLELEESEPATGVNSWSDPRVGV